MFPTQDIIFRVFMAISFAVGWFVRFDIQRKVKTRSNVKSIESRREAFSLRLGHVAFTLPLLYIVTTLLDFACLGFPLWLRWIGVAILSGGNAVFYTAHRALGLNWSGTLEIKENHSLVTSGIYRYIRHPMYSGFFLLSAGLFLCSANWLIGAATLGFSTFMYWRRIDDEEQMMIDTFGEAYRQYMQRTGRLFPKI